MVVTLPCQLKRLIGASRSVQKKLHGQIWCWYVFPSALPRWWGKNIRKTESWSRPSPKTPCPFDRAFLWIYIWKNNKPNNCLPGGYQKKLLSTGHMSYTYIPALCFEIKNFSLVANLVGYWIANALTKVSSPSVETALATFVLHGRSIATHTLTRMLTEFLQAEWP